MNEIVVLGQWEKAKLAVADCKNIDEAKNIKDKAQVLQAYAKQAKESLEVQNNVAEIKLRAERKIGEFSSGLEKGTKWSNVHDEQLKTTTLKDAGIKNYQRYEAIASLPEKEFQEHIDKVKASNEELTTVGVIKMVRKLKWQSQPNTEAPPPPEGKYELIVIDPPWKYGTNYDEDTRRVASPYPEINQDELKELYMPSADNCVMWLWTTHKFIWDAKELLDLWGFDYKATLVWDKEKMGMGVWLRMQAEFCLLGIKGKPQWSLTNQRDVLRVKRREHSRKPDEFYEMASTLTPTKHKIDMFGREGRKGWVVWGNEYDKFSR